MVLVHSAVQGAEAPAQISRGIELLNRYRDVDLIIVGRGGGSFEDLMPFNSEEVVRAIFESALPVISAVGHEVDNTLADLAADIRAATPTQAAQMAVADLAQINREFDQLSQRLIRIMQRRMQQENEILDRLMMDRAWQRPLTMIEDRRQRHGDLSQQLLKAVAKSMDAPQKRLMVAVTGLDRLSPLKVIQRGYAVVRNNEGIIRSIDSIQSGDDIIISVWDGELQATVQQKEKVVRWNQ